MRAVQVTGFGGPEVLAWGDVDDPVPGPGELLVEVRASAVNWADLLQRQGKYPGGPQPPFVIGHDVVGDVVAHGPGVDSPPIGTRVFGVLGRPGACAELVVAPVGVLHEAPENLSDAAAAGLAAPYFTADAAIVTFGRLQPGDSVLIHAAAGAFGSACVQLCRAYGAGTIIATAGADEKLARVAEWGADVLVNYTTSDFVEPTLAATAGLGVDVLLESVGGSVLERSFDCIAPTGRLVSVGASSGQSTKRFRLHTLFEKGISVSGFTLGLWLQSRPDLVAPTIERVIDLAARGTIDPVVGAVFPRDEVAEAHRFLENRQSVGRTVVSLR